MRIFPEQKEMTKDDFVIICGDFGGVWNKGEESKEETTLMEKFLNRTILIIRKKKELDRGWRSYRINHVSWWRQELPSAEEILLYEQIIRIS